jgi:putative two-component system response regulator
MLESIQAKPTLAKVHLELSDTCKRYGMLDHALEQYAAYHTVSTEVQVQVAQNRAHLTIVQNNYEKAQLEAEIHRRKASELEQLVFERTKDLEAAQLEMLERLAVASEYRDADTGEHTKRVGELSADLATRLGLPPKRVALLRHAARLHDLGKIAIRDDILLKPGKLTPEERKAMEDHTLQGARMLENGHSELLKLAHQIALTHHERWDGTGYPRGIAGREIPISGRIVALVDVFDALLHRRPYKDPWTHEDAVREICKQSGKHFDPEVVEAFLDYCRDTAPVRQAFDEFLISLRNEVLLMA